MGDMPSRGYEENLPGRLWGAELLMFTGKLQKDNSLLIARVTQK